VGRLLADKGVREFVNAARTLSREFPGTEFQLLGPLDTENRTAIAGEEVERWVEEGSVEYLGATDDVRPAIAGATAVVLPSYREGLPRSLLEAGAMGRPLIATDVPGCREIVVDGETGFLCKARDSTSLAKAMKKLAILSIDERKRMGHAARGLIERRFSEKLVIGAYLDALENFRAPGS
jgi:glycosyltransferase involved in cell wall biosynthesis